MKKIVFIAMIVLCALNLEAQAVLGDWYGKISVMNQEMRLNFHITKDADVYSATMDSPDQGAFGIPMESVVYKDGVLTLKVANIQYDASLDENGNLNGVFRQSVLSADLFMSHKPIETEKKQIVSRPQTPKEPFPYSTEDVRFAGGGDYQLAGTLSLPKNSDLHTPMVVFVTGSGPQDRNETIMGHKPFWVLADAFARNGIASLRFDDRGIGGSTGDFRIGTTQDNIKDAQSAIAFLKSRGYDNIGAIGHSEGGMIVANLSAEDCSLSFLVSLAGTGVSGADVLERQASDIFSVSEGAEDALALNVYTRNIINEIVAEKADAVEKALVIVEKHCAMIPDSLIETTGSDRETYLSLIKAQLCDPWMLYFIQYDPSEAWARVNCPVLALNGEKDLQVNYEVNLEEISKAIGGKVPLETRSYPNLNHLFQHCTVGLPAEYEEIEETISPEVMDDIVAFIKSLPIKK
jgi:Predicted hydrolases or acyltransferases (alpha/beta hydrolase superfamily)